MSTFGATHSQWCMSAKMMKKMLSLYSHHLVVIIKTVNVCVLCAVIHRM